MTALGPQRILELWDQEPSLHHLERSTAMLDSEEIGALPIGRRDALLLRLHERNFGPSLPMQSRCPQCGEEISFDVAVADLLQASPDAQPAEIYLLETDGFSIEFRLPCTRDFLEAAGAGSRDAVRDSLFGACLLGATKQGEKSSPMELPSHIRAQIGAAITAADPLSEITFALQCPECEHEWAELVDPEDFVWTEIASLAQRYLAEVDMLASAYHWSESDILKLGSRRRRAYLELVSV